MKGLALHNFVKIKKFWSSQQVGEQFNNPVCVVV